MSDNEYHTVVNKLLHRLPNFTEAGILAGMWSEHCSYKNTKPLLRHFWSKGSKVLEGPGEDAGAIDIGDNQAVIFKAESHNHPSYVEPFEGAATGVGGIIRDIFSMGARPVALLDSLRFGELTNQKNKFLMDRTVDGIAHYGNSIGIPTVGGEIGFDSTYDKNSLVNVMCVGIENQDDLKQDKASGIGNSIIYVGAKTGRDGINGATFASNEFSDSKESDRSAVQVGDPFMEKLLVDACLDIIHHHSDILVGIQDMGAAGLVSSSAEMASKAKSGVDLNLDLVPQREPHMTPYEILLSESQERMLLCVKKGHEKTIIDIFKRFGLDGVVIGHVNNNGQYHLTQHGETVCNIPVHTIVDDVPEYTHPIIEPDRIKHPAADFVPTVNDAGQMLAKLLSQPTIASKQSVYRQYDSRVQTNTVVAPGSDAGIIRIRHTDKALAMTTDCNGRYVYLNPEIGGEIATSEAARNIVAGGGLPIGATDCLNFGNPEDSESYYALAKSIDGITKACKLFDTPVISGNVSLHNETDRKPIYPTPLIGMVGLIKHDDEITTQDAKHAGDLVYIVGKTYDDYSGSEIQKLIQHQISGRIKHFDLQTENKNRKLVYQSIVNHLVQSVHDLSEGGLGVSIAETLFKHDFGFNGQLDLLGRQLFAETQSRYVITVAPKQKNAFEKLMGDCVKQIGQITKEPIVKIKLNDQDVNMNETDLKQKWERGLN